MDENGCAGPVFSASLRFACPPGKENWPWFDPAVEPGGSSCPEAVAGFAPVYNWVTKLHEADRRICFGFELDAATAASGPAAVHFQHYEKLHLAEEFCKRMGDPDTGKLYLDLAERMPAEWRPSLFGMFRGRAGSLLQTSFNWYIIHASDNTASIRFEGRLHH